MISHPAWGIASAVIDAASFPVYAAGIRWRGRRPGRVGWIMYGLFYCYIAAAQASAGATWSNLIAVTEAAGCAWIAWLSVHHGEDDLNRGPGDAWWMLPARNPVTALCFAWLAAACALWGVVSADTRIVLIVSVDALATWQVVRYAARHGGESPASWAMYGLAAGLSAGAVTQAWPSILYLYPVAGEVFGAAVVCALWAHSVTPAVGDDTPSGPGMRLLAAEDRADGPAPGLVKASCTSADPRAAGATSARGAQPLPPQAGVAG